MEQKQELQEISKREEAKATRKTIITDLSKDKNFRQKLQKIAATAPLEDIIDLINNEIKSQTTVTSFHYQIEGLYQDVAYHFNEAAKDLIGFTTIKGEKGASGENPPRFLTVAFADGSSVKVPVGKISLPILGEDAFVELEYEEGSMIMHVFAEAERRFEKRLDELVKEVKNRVKYNSIYGGKAIIFNDDILFPKFVDVSKYKEMPLFLNKDTKEALIPLETRLSKTKELEEKGIDIKYGALMEGPYGTGKTLAAWKLAQKAVENGWTFLYLKDPNNVIKIMEIAQQLSHSGRGVLTFIEDIDLVLSGERDVEMNEIINMMDAGDNKKLNTIYLFTTNHIEKINPTFLRGKRIGALISMEHLDNETTEEFIRYFLGDKLDVSEDLTEVVNLIVENRIAPAFLSEIVEKALTNLIFHEKDYIDANTIKVYVNSYIRQVKIVQQEREEPKERQFVKLFKDILNTEEAVKSVLKEARIV